MGEKSAQIRKEEARRLTMGAGKSRNFVRNRSGFLLRVGVQPLRHEIACAFPGEVRQLVVRFDHDSLSRLFFAIGRRDGDDRDQQH